MEQDCFDRTGKLPREKDHSYLKKKKTLKERLKNIKWDFLFRYILQPITDYFYANAIYATPTTWKVSEQFSYLNKHLNASIPYFLTRDEPIGVDEFSYVRLDKVVYLYGGRILKTGVDNMSYDEKRIKAVRGRFATFFIIKKLRSRLIENGKINDKLESIFPGMSKIQGKMWELQQGIRKNL